MGSQERTLHGNAMSAYSQSVTAFTCGTTCKNNFERLMCKYSAQCHLDVVFGCVW